MSKILCKKCIIKGNIYYILGFHVNMYYAVKGIKLKPHVIFEDKINKNKDFKKINKKEILFLIKNIKKQLVLHNQDEKDNNYENNTYLGYNRAKVYEMFLQKYSIIHKLKKM